MKSSDIFGLFIYQEPNRTVYCDIFSKNGYIINNAEAKTYQTWGFRLPIALVLFILLPEYVFDGNYYLSGAIALAVFVISSIVFRIVYIPKLPAIRNYQKPKRDSIAKKLSDGHRKSSLYLFGISALILGPLAIFNAYHQHYDGLNLFANYLVGDLLFAAGILHIYSAIKYGGEDGAPHFNDNETKHLK